MCSVVKAVDGLANVLKGVLGDPGARNGIMTARAQVQEYSSPYDDYCDLPDLCDLLAQRVGNTAVKRAAAPAIVASGFKGSAVDNSNGISIYFAKRKLSPLYGSLDFAKQNAWNEFIEAYLQSIGR